MNRVAVIQNNAQDDVANNLKRLDPLLQQAVDQSAKLVVLSENFAFMKRTDEQLMSAAEAFGFGPIQDYLATFCQKHGIWIIAGSVHIRSEQSDKVWNAQLVFDDDGKIVARYNKIHLFDVQLSDAESYCESDSFLPGDKVVVVDTPIGRVGLSICYDVRFPELYRAMVDQGAEMFTIPAAFTVPTGQAHWHALMRARAIENSCYVLAPGQYGLHPNGRQTYGHSVIVGPWGEVLTEQADGDGVLIATIDLKALQRVRTQLPSLANRRLDLFD